MIHSAVISLFNPIRTTFTDKLYCLQCLDKSAALSYGCQYSWVYLNLDSSEKVSSLGRFPHLIAYDTRWVCDLNCLLSSPNSRQLPRFRHASSRGASASVGKFTASQREELRWNIFLFISPSSPSYSQIPKVMTVCPHARNRCFWNLVTADTLWLRPRPRLARLAKLVCRCH